MLHRTLIAIVVSCSFCSSAWAGEPQPSEKADDATLTPAELCARGDDKLAADPEGCKKDLQRFADAAGTEIWGRLSACMGVNEVVTADAFFSCIGPEAEALLASACGKVTVASAEQCASELPKMMSLNPDPVTQIALLRCLDAHESLGSDQLDACTMKAGLPALPWRTD